MSEKFRSITHSVRVGGVGGGGGGIEDISNVYIKFDNIFL